MPQRRTQISFVAITRYRELWLRLCDIFPTVLMDLERGNEQQIIMYESYRYNAVVEGEGYMVWTMPSSASFWEKAILPILAEYKAERVAWSKHRYNPRVFLVKLPLSSSGVTHFREWVQSGSMNTESFVRASLYDDHDEHSTYDDDWWDCYYDEPDTDEIYAAYTEKFDKQTRRKRV